MIFGDVIIHEFKDIVHKAVMYITLFYER